MPVKVVDASALAALVFAEPEADKMARAMDGARLIAPSLLPYELASVCLKKIHRSPQKAKVLKTAFHMAKRLAIKIVTAQTFSTIQTLNDHQKHSNPPAHTDPFQS